MYRKFFAVFNSVVDRAMFLAISYIIMIRFIPPFILLYIMGIIYVCLKTFIYAYNFLNALFIFFIFYGFA